MAELSAATQGKIRKRVNELRLKHGESKANMIVGRAWSIQNYFYSAILNTPRELRGDVAQLVIQNIADAREELDKVLATLERQPDDA